MSQTQQAPFVRSPQPNWARGKSGGSASTTKPTLMPDIGESTYLFIDDSSWTSVGQYLFLTSGTTLGYFKLIALDTGVLNVEAVDYDNHAAKGVLFPAGSALRIASNPPVGAPASAIAPIPELPGKTTTQGALEELAAITYGMANVRQFGAVGNGISDDTASFQAAIATGKLVFIPYGTYRISSSLELVEGGLIGQGWGTDVDAQKTRLVFYNLVLPTSAAIAARVGTAKAPIRIENIQIVASSWDPATGGNGYGLDIETRVLCRHVMVTGFRSHGYFLHANTGNTSGPYQSMFDNCASYTNGGHGVLLAAGANTVTFLNLLSFWNGAPAYNTVPTLAGNYDGFHVVQAYSGYASYTPQMVTVIGGDCSYNSRYGWNLNQIADSLCLCGYAEANLGATQNNVGASCTNSLVRFAVGSVTNNSSNNAETVYGDMVLPGSPGIIRSNTNDGADSKFLSLAGGGAASTARGGIVNVVGNDFASASSQGIVQVLAGYDAAMSDALAGSIVLQTGTGGKQLYMFRSGGVHLTSSGSPSDPGAGNLKAAGSLAAGSTVSGTSINVSNSSTLGGQGSVKTTDATGISNLQLTPSTGSPGWIGIVNPSYSNGGFPALTPGAVHIYSPGDASIVADGAGQFRVQCGNGASNLSLVLNNSRALRLPAYGAGTLTTDASGNVTATSDKALKDVIRSFTRGKDAIRALKSVSYRWNEQSGLDREFYYVGWLAQDVLEVLPEAIGVMADGHLSLSDRPILATAVNAIAEAFGEVDALRKRIEALEIKLA